MSPQEPKILTVPQCRVTVQRGRGDVYRTGLCLRYAHKKVCLESFQEDYY